MSTATHIVTVLTRDRRGIIYRLVEALASQDVPHIEISQTVVHGAFTIALVIAVPEGVDPDAVRDALTATLDDDASTSLLALDASIAPDADTPDRNMPLTAASSMIDREPAPGWSEDGHTRYILTAIGQGVGGVVREISGIVLAHGGNFSDFSSQIVDGRVQLLAEVELSDNTVLGALQSALADASRHPHLAIRLQHQRLFSATNEIAFRRRQT